MSLTQSPAAYIRRRASSQAVYVYINVAATLIAILILTAQLLLAYGPAEASKERPNYVVHEVMIHYGYADHSLFVDIYISAHTSTEEVHELTEDEALAMISETQLASISCIRAALPDLPVVYYGYGTFPENEIFTRVRSYDSLLSASCHDHSMRPIHPDWHAS